MNKKESLALYEQGREAWNVWAEAMLAEKVVLKEQGGWEKEKAEWNNRAVANFEQCNFKRFVSFRNFAFPGDANFQRTTFHNAVDFENATFSCFSNFEKVTFLGHANFEHTEFCNIAHFDFAMFSDFANFNGATFSGSANFIKTTFHRQIYFGKSTFSDFTVFKKATFFGDTNFESVKFQGSTEFSGAQFVPPKGQMSPDVNFTASEGLGYFTLGNSIFAKVPNFTQTSFQQAPSLDEIEIGDKKNASEPENLAPRWRHLRRLATQGHDHENERNFFAREIQARRNVQDFAFGENWQRYWVGQLYEVFSDFGRSVWRPFAWWIASTVIFGWAYLMQNSALKFGEQASLFQFRCFDSNASAISAAANLTLSRASVFGKLAGGDGIERSLQCLFGTNTDLFSNNAPVIHIPDWVTFAGYGQSLFSAVMIFLVLLALRNQFRIR